MNLHTSPSGWVPSATKWMPAVHSPAATDVEVGAPWVRNDTTGNLLRYQAGLGGPCSQLDPPYGYWCNAHPNRTTSGALTHRFPSGLTYTPAQLPNAANYSSVAGAILHAWRPALWFTWAFAVDSHDAATNALRWTRGVDRRPLAEAVLPARWVAAGWWRLGEGECSRRRGECSRAGASCRARGCSNVTSAPCHLQCAGRS